MKTDTAPQRISIIGAGILGLTCAHILAKRFGQNAIHIYDEGGFPSDNASFMAGGMLAPYSELDHMPHDFLHAGLESIAFWKNLSSTADFEFSQNGSLLLAHESDRHLLERFKTILPAGGDWNAVGPAETKALEPALARKFMHGITLPAEAHLHPQKVMRALCDDIQNKYASSADPQALAKTSDWVIDCRGMGAATEDSNLRGVKGEILIVRNAEFKFSRPVRLMHPRYPLYIVPRANNIFMIGATIIESAEKDTVSLRSGLELMSALFSLHPSFADAEILDIKSGVRPAYSDNLPHIYVKNNVIICNGLYRHGYLLSPVMAKSAEALILDQNYEFTRLFLKDKNNEHHIERKAARG